MVRRILVGLILVATVMLGASPAGATCQPGRIGIENGKPVVQLPRCEPYPP